MGSNILELWESNSAKTMAIFFDGYCYYMEVRLGKDSFNSFCRKIEKNKVLYRYLSTMYVTAKWLSRGLHVMMVGVTV